FILAAFPLALVVLGKLSAGILYLCRESIKKLFIMKNYNNKNSTRPWIITGIVIAVIGFVGWWGIAKMNQQKAEMVVTSSEKALAPDFTLPSTTGGTITLSDFRGKKNVLIYFNEGLSCQPCWEQIPELEKYMGDFEKMNVTLLNVSFDSVDKWKETIDSYKIKTPVLSYGFEGTEADYNLMPFSMGMGTGADHMGGSTGNRGRAGHTFILVGTDGIIKWRVDYWPSRGHMVAGGVMFVEGSEVVKNVQKALES
ncbi:MAG: redoxin domain-containing protein, partial [bacterium]